MLTTKVIAIFAGTTSWIVPNDWNNSNNSIECIGAGDNGVNNTGGHGGAYAAIYNQVLNRGSSIVIAIGVGGSSVDTDFNNSSCKAQCGANGGLASGTNSIGTLKNPGGAGGGPSGGGGSGGGGGGAAGPNGAGVNGGTAVGGVGFLSGGGGAGDNGNIGSGAGGAVTGKNSAPNAGGAGSEYTSNPGGVTAGSGGGGGGASGPASNLVGGAGGAYGGGGGGGFSSSSTGGTGGDGLIVITYVPNGANYGYGIVQNNGILYARTANADYSLATITANKWLNICLVYSGIGASAYVNGVFVGFNSNAAILYNTGVTSFAIGCNGIGTGIELLNGNIGPTQLFNTALTPAQILQNFNVFKGRFGL